MSNPTHAPDMESEGKQSSKITQQSTDHQSQRIDMLHGLDIARNQLKSVYAPLMPHFATAQRQAIVTQLNRAVGNRRVAGVVQANNKANNQPLWSGEIKGATSVALRATPRKNPQAPYDKILADLPQGTRVTVQDSQSNWYLVVVYKHGERLTGYVSSEYVHRTERKTKAGTPALTIETFIEVVRQLEEQYPTLNPHRILVMLRKIYYDDNKWDRVLPRSQRLETTDNKRTPQLKQQLEDNQVVDGVDIGHIFTGVEAMLNPTQEVNFMGGLYDVEMPNVEFATWGGDIGSAAGESVVDQLNGGKQRNIHQHFESLAANSDLEGNIHAYGLTGGGDTRIIGGKNKLSDILRQYFLQKDTPLGRRHTNRYVIFTTSIGGRLSRDNKSIINRDDLIKQIAPKVQDFALAWAANKDKRAFLYQPLLRTRSIEVTGLFLDWLQQKLSR